jgi:sigma-B regulation protein RsbU (phosphoserine phosphatase)
MDASGSPKPVQLRSTGPMVGAFDDIEYGSETCEIPEGSKLFLYSDGVFEIELPPNGTRWPFPEFTGLMGRPSEPEGSDMDRLIRTIRELTGKEGFDDDFSIVELRF